jgi:hypothetical protein
MTLEKTPAAPMAGRHGPFGVDGQAHEFVELGVEDVEGRVNSADEGPRTVILTFQ